MTEPVQLTHEVAEAIVAVARICDDDRGVMVKPTTIVGTNGHVAMIVLMDTSVAAPKGSVGMIVNMDIADAVDQASKSNGSEMWTCMLDVDGSAIVDSPAACGDMRLTGGGMKQETRYPPVEDVIGARRATVGNRVRLDCAKLKKLLDAIEELGHTSVIIDVMPHEITTGAPLPARLGSPTIGNMENMNPVLFLPGKKTDGEKTRSEGSYMDRSIPFEAALMPMRGDLS
jgi:hypothetical protein